MQACRYLVINSGTSQSPEFTRQRDRYACGALAALRPFNFKPPTGLKINTTTMADAFSDALYFSYGKTSGLRLPGTTRLGVPPSLARSESKEWSIETAIEGISHFVPEYFPEQELEYLLTKPDEVTPLLLKALDDAANVNTPVDDSMLHVFALYLLAHFRSEAAFPKIINILKLPDELPYRILGDDCITDYGMRNVLASTFNGDLSLLTTIIENRDIEQHIRGSVLNTFIPLVLLEKIEKKTVTAYLKTLIEEKLEKEQPYLWAVVTGVVMDLYLDELASSIMDAFQNDYVDENYCEIEDFESWFDDKKEYMDAMPHLKENYHFIDAIQDTKWWACFQSEKTLKKDQAMLDNFLTSVSLPRYKFWDIPVPRIHSPTRQVCLRRPGRPASVQF